jgi:hypothetical protein
MRIQSYGERLRGHCNLVSRLTCVTFCLQTKAVFIFLYLMLLLCACSRATAHQPRIVPVDRKPVRITQPEVSQAFYGRLKQVPQEFIIESRVAFDLYINLLVPKIPGIQKDLRVKVNGPGKKTFVILQGKKATWTIFHEPFSGTDYYRGPEFRSHVPAGTYILQVSRPRNYGKYVLAVGEKEVFSSADMLQAMQIVSQLKKDFFTDSPQ